MTQSTNGEKSLDELSEEARRAREQLARDVDALTYKVSPENLKSEAKQAVRDVAGAAKQRAIETAEATTQASIRAVHQVETAVRENPAATALIGIGLGWLTFRALRPGGSRSVHHERPMRRTRAATERVREVAGKIERDASAIGHAWVERGRSAEQSAERWVARTYTENPLFIGVAALSGGFALGLMLPVTKQEQNAFGDTSRRVTRAVTEGAREVAASNGVGAAPPKPPLKRSTTTDWPVTG